MPRDYKNNKSEPKIKNTNNLFSFLIGLVLGTFATNIYFNQNENIHKGKPSFNDNNYNNTRPIKLRSQGPFIFKLYHS